MQLDLNTLIVVDCIDEFTFFFNGFKLNGIDHLCAFGVSYHFKVDYVLK